MAKKSSCVYTAPYGSRGIYYKGKPAFSISRAESGAMSPVQVDAAARKIVRLLCSRR